MAVRREWRLGSPCCCRVEQGGERKIWKRIWDKWWERVVYMGEGVNSFSRTMGIAYSIAWGEGGFDEPWSGQVVVVLSKSNLVLSSPITNLIVCLMMLDEECLRCFVEMSTIARSILLFSHFKNQGFRMEPK